MSLSEAENLVGREVRSALEPDRPACMSSGLADMMEKKKGLEEDDAETVAEGDL